MSQLSLTQNPRNNQDKRIGIAYKIYETFPSGNYLIHKTTRAGATTALLAESMNRNEKFLCVVPTNKIADDTVVSDSKKYSDLFDADVIHIPANHECIFNKELCKEYPDLKKLPILPLAGACSDCHNFDICEVTAVLRKPDSHGVVITYKKLAALMMASGSIPNTMAERILTDLSLSKNLILDEIHEIQFGDYTNITVYDSEIGNLVNIKKYHKVDTEFKYLRRILNEFGELLKCKQVKVSIHEVLGAAQDSDFWKHHLNISMKNPTNGVLEGESEYKVTVGAYNELINITKKRECFDLEMKDILELFYMMSIIMSKTISINAIRDQGIIKINLAAVNNAYIKMIQSFIMSMQKEDKRILLTSATICSYDYGSMFLGGVKPKNISFGVGGDPMNTNAKMLILADSKKYSDIGRSSRYNKKDEIVEKTTRIMDLYGEENCIIIALNRREAMKLEYALEEVGYKHKVTYYKAPEMMGVSAKQRVMIAIGIANKPSNSFDVITTNTEDSKVMLWESVHCDTWQAWSRVKDPMGKDPSLVFALGCSVEECTALTTWGYNRKVEIEPYKERQKKKINVVCERGSITTPEILKCRSFEDMVKEAMKHKLSKNFTENVKNLPIENCLNKLPEMSKISLFINNIGRFVEKTGVCLRSSEELIYLVLNRVDVFAQQNPKGGYLKTKIPINDFLIKQHLEGKMTIGAYQFNLENKVKWVCFDIDSHAPKNKVETEEDVKIRDALAESNCLKMCTFLKNNGLSYVLEKSGSPHSYHIWIFLKAVDGKIAKQFATDIKNETGIDCEVFPKQDKIGKDGYGNLVKVPFATHQIHKLRSMIEVNGEFVSSISNLEIEVLDISRYPLPEPEVKVKKPVTKAKITDYVNYRTKVRPCIENALKMQLTGTQGHFMRIAVCREYFNSGLRDPEQLVSLYKGQADYSHDESMKGVMSIIKKESKNVRCDRLRVEASNFVNCAGCPLNGGGVESFRVPRSGLNGEVTV